jgi:hypothetical protein
MALAGHPYQRSIGLFALALVLLFLKSPDAILAPQFWAEDGPVFFAAQFGQDWPQLLTPYAGYLHTVPRLVAWIATWFDLAHAPLVYNALAILIDAACIAYVSLRLAAWFPQWAVFLSFFIVPSSGDIFGTATNVQWFMQFVLAAACLVPAAGPHAAPRPVRIAGHAALALAALSGPFSVLVSGLAVGAMLMGARRFAPAGPGPSFGLSNIVRAIAPVGSRLSRANLLVVLACAFVQAVVLIPNELRTPAETFLLSPELQASLGVSKLESFYFYTVTNPFLKSQLAYLAAMVAVTTACLMYTLLRPAPWNGVACLFLALGVAQPVLAYMKERNVFTLTATSHYFFLLSVACCWIAWHLLRTHLPEQRKPAFAIVAALLLMGVLFRTDYFRREPLHDLGWARHVDRIRNGGPASVMVPINPAPWYFKVNGR